MRDVGDGQARLAEDQGRRAFYKSQGSRYDGFREALLLGRDLLMQHAVPWVKKPKTCISVGCGTARDVEFVTGHVKAAGTKVYLVDLSDALLDTARARVLELGLQTQVVLVEGDINSHAVRKKLPKKADLVTCSYCLTMIPPWKEALATMLDLVEVGGRPRAFFDFVTREGREKRFFQKLYKWWFAMDGASTAATWTGCARRRTSPPSGTRRRRAACPTRPTAPRTTSTAPRRRRSAARTVAETLRAAEARRIFF